MQDLDDLLTRTAEHLAQAVDPSGAFERMVARKRRRRIVRRIEVITIITVFVGGTVTGAIALARVFRVGHPHRPAATASTHLPLTGNGKIAFSADDGAGHGSWNIYEVNADGTGLTRLTSDPSVEARPAWSPDGTRIAFVRANADGTDEEIYVMNADGRGVRNLTGSAGGWKPAWSPDGQMIAFGRGSEILVMRADGRDVQQVTHSGEGVADYPAWSPDGASIAFTSGIAGNPGGIWLVHADGSGLRRVFLEKDPGVADLLRPGSWSPDGVKILFERSPSNFAKNPLVAGIWSIQQDGTGLKRITAYKGVGFASWSPDGTKIVFIRNDRDVYVMNADGTGLTRLTTDQSTKFFTSWQPVAAR